jgi:hypothetical protein
MLKTTAGERNLNLFSDFWTPLALFEFEIRMESVKVETIEIGLIFKTRPSEWI